MRRGRSQVPNISCSGDSMDKGGNDDKLRTLECLRGRLLAERVASKAAKDEAEEMANRLAELERLVAEETKYRNRAEKRLRYALKKLESLKILDVSGLSIPSESSVSLSSHSSGFSGNRRSMKDSGQCGLGGEVEEIVHDLGSDDIHGDDGSGNFSSGDSSLQLVSQERSCSSVGTAHSCNKESPPRGEDCNNVSHHEQPISDAAVRSRQSSLNGDEQDEATHQPKHVENALAIVPVSMSPNSGDCRPNINSNNTNVQAVLVALRHVKEQLQNSMGRRIASVSSPTELYGQ